jgi:hypothetical protein
MIDIATPADAFHHAAADIIFSWLLSPIVFRRRFSPITAFFELMPILRPPLRHFSAFLIFLSIYAFAVEPLRFLSIADTPPYYGSAEMPLSFSRFHYCRAFAMPLLFGLLSCHFLRHSFSFY